MKVLVIGSGGREHALAHTFHRQGHAVCCLPGNGGTAEFCDPFSSREDRFDLFKFDQLISYVKEQQIDLTVVGPEDFLTKGIANAFASSHLPLFGPSQEASLLEGSKAWAKKFMSKHRIPTARFAICSSEEEARQVIRLNFEGWNGVVIKPDGLTNGKGVTCCKTEKEAEAAIVEIMKEKRYGAAGATVVLEEHLSGKEISLLALCDGKMILPMIPSQDHKRLHDGDMGPNTGGMGAYAPVSFVTKSIMEQIQSLIVQRTQEGLEREHITYQGILYFGIMLTTGGPKILEYNCRFGDPETQALLPLLNSDLAHLMLACCSGNLRSKELLWKSQSACCVVMASEGYPYSVSQTQATKNNEILGLDRLKDQKDLLVFHAGTKKGNNGEILSAGGRVLGVTGIGNSLTEAVHQAYKGVDAIHFPGAQYRRDIAYQGGDLNC